MLFRVPYVRVYPAFGQRPYFYPRSISETFVLSTVVKAFQSYFIGFPFQRTLCRSLEKNNLIFVNIQIESIYHETTRFNFIGS